MDLDWLEAYALADDREAALTQLIPGSEPFYYFSCLHAQQRGQLDRVDELLASWRKRHRNSSQIDAIAMRQLVLRLDSQPNESCNEIRRQLHVEFNHQREVELARGALPTHLDQDIVAGSTLAALARKNYPGSAGGFTVHGLRWLLDDPSLDPATRHDMLSRLKTPEHPALVDHIAADLRDRQTSFGSLAIHLALLPEQLSALATRLPSLKTDPTFVECRLIHLQPAPDDNWQVDLEMKRDYFDRLWREVSSLGAAFNSLRAHILYHRLDVGRELGAYSFELFYAYLRTPRSASYLARRFREANKHNIAQLGANYATATLLPPVGDDQALVFDYLRELLVDAEELGDLGELLDLRTLRSWFAAIKILAGSANLERWHQLLDDDSVFAELRDRVDIDLISSNRRHYQADETVVIEARVKNVQSLVLNVFEVNAFNFALRNGALPDTAIDLDGLVATQSKTFELDEPPFRSVARRFELEQLTNPGIYVIELLGGGKSSRALVRKGGLYATERVGSAGHAFSIYDELNERVSDAILHFSGSAYHADEAGEIHVPFSTHAGRQRAVISAGHRVDVMQFNQRAENYTIAAGIFVARESLIAGNKAMLVATPRLRVAGIETTLALLERPRMVLTTVNRRGITAQREYTDIELSDDADLTQGFRVPEDLASLSITISGTVRSVSEQRDIELEASATFAVNTIDSEAHISALHLGQDGNKYVAYALGKNGEPRADLGIAMKFRHLDFTDIVTTTLQTDDRGRIELGRIDGVVSLSARNPGGVTAQWLVEQAHTNLPSAVHVAAGERIELAAESGGFSIFEQRGRGFLADRTTAGREKGGALVIEGLEPGDYILSVGIDRRRVQIRVASGRRTGGCIVGTTRILEATEGRSTVVESAQFESGKIKISLRGHSSEARVHIEAARFADSRSLWDCIGTTISMSAKNLYSIAPPRSFYVSGRELGDEYRYILDRARATKLPGSPVKRPSLLLNPWARGATDTQTIGAAAGGVCAAESMSMQAPAPARQPAPRKAPARANTGEYANVDFLAKPAVVLCNLKPDANGVVEVDADLLGGFGVLRFLVVDTETAISGIVPLEEPATERRDLRQTQTIDSGRHVSEVREISALLSGEELSVEDISSATVDIVDTVGQVHSVFSSVTNNSVLAEFSFAMRWPQLAKEKQLERYSEFASHELNLFLYFKDRDFFQRVIAAYLGDKHHKTFLDRYFVGSTLDDYLEPWRYNRLNTLERILLAERLGDSIEVTSKRIRDHVELSPRDLSGEQRLFDAVGGGGALKDDSLGMNQAKSRSRSAKKMKPGYALAPMAATAFPADEAGLSEAEDFDDESIADKAEGGGYGRRDQKRDLARREQAPRLYRSPDQTKELAENNYWKLRPNEQAANLIVPNRFWHDYATRDSARPFLSSHFPQATSTFTEMMAALAVLDLPFEAGDHEATYQDSSMNLKLASSSLVFHKQIADAPSREKPVPVLVSQDYFRADDRYVWKDGEQLDNFVAGELLTFVIYTCRLVVTNPTASPKKLRVLQQIPQGSMPVANATKTGAQPVELAPHGTAAVEYSFYFPEPGRFSHYGAQVTLDEELISSIDTRSLDVVSTLSEIDKESWAYVSQHGDDKTVLAHLENANLARLDLDKIAWRMREPAMFASTLEVLSRHRVFHEQLWSYSIHHCDIARVAEYLRHRTDFVGRLGPEAAVGRLQIDSVSRGDHELLEYAPLINARAHRLGKKRQIANQALQAQYTEALERLAHTPTLGDEEWLEVANYLFMQDRIDEAISALGKLPSTASSLQLDYTRGYLALLTGKTDEAANIAARRADHPVERWRHRFNSIAAAIARVGGSDPVTTDSDDREASHDAMAAKTAGLDLVQKDGEILIRYQNLSGCTLNFYSMDIELLFSRQPFLREATERFSQIRANHVGAVTFENASGEHGIEIPTELANKNVVIEVDGGGIQRSVVHYAHDLALQMVERYGQLRVGSAGSGAPIAGAYVKVYARKHGGAVEFYKDGYTDITGSFDYASISTDALDNVDRFAVLILEPQRGSLITEAGPPAR